MLLLVDAAMLAGANGLFWLARFKWSWLPPPTYDMVTVVLPMAFFTSFWLVLFAFFGLYRERHAESRLDELISLTKVVTVGLFILFFIIFVDTLNPESARSVLPFYWVLVLGCTAVGRLAVRSVQKALILRGYGVHKALIVGWSDQVGRLHDDIARYPAAGLNVVGAIRMERSTDSPTPLPHGDGGPPSYPSGDGGLAVPTKPATTLYRLEALPRLIDELEIQDVLIALGSADHEPLMEVLRLCDGKPVSLKLVPDFYTLIGGMARTEHIYGLPLIEVLPEPMPAWEQSTKRLLDLVVASAVLLVGLPIWVLLGSLVRLTSPGPAIYRQIRVGQHGRAFTMLKFRTMGANAEKETGPVWAQENDPRYTPLGRWLRKSRLDEVPQLWNVLKGEMSLVGPRPERPYFVEQLAREIPLYSRRHRVKPGITGWAQVKWKYDESLEDVRQKVKYDLFYIENMSLRMDIKILFRTIRTALTAQGQ